MATLKAPEVVVTGCNISTCADEELQINEDIAAQYKDSHIETAKIIFKTVLEDWMYGYLTIYTQNHYMPLFERILDFVSQDKIINFLLPGFPVKSPNNISKVLGRRADFAEFLAIRSFIVTIRKLQLVYSAGAELTIMSDYHTFDKYIGTTEEAYNTYHADSKEIIANAGASDIIQIINLSSFPEFQDTTMAEISTKLGKDYGGSEFLENFDENIRDDSELLERYKQMLKFMQKDQEPSLPGSPRSRRSRVFLKEVTRGMMSQGLSLDTFLKEQETLSDYVRISIHEHHPKGGKFSVDLFKQNSLQDGVLRTPWHHTVLFDTLKGDYTIQHKDRLLQAAVTGESRVYTVTHKQRSWFLIKLYFSPRTNLKYAVDLEVTMMKDGCGVMITNKTSNRKLESNIFQPTTLTSILKEFGIVVLRGFSHFKNEKEFFDHYCAQETHGVIPWKFGSVHKVKVNREMPGMVNENGVVPIHWDLVLPPTYMGISQSAFKYEDYTCREFTLYCRRNSQFGTLGATTFVDAYGVLLALPTNVMERWQRINLIYEIRLTQNTDKKLLYFGGEDNKFEYPLVQKCPWTHKDVLRWCELWTEEDHPGTSQTQWYEITSNSKQSVTSNGNSSVTSISSHSPTSNSKYSVKPTTTHSMTSNSNQSSTSNSIRNITLDFEQKMTSKELENEIQSYAFDQRFFFEHDYEEGDQVYVNNYTMLHGRKSFSNDRELWRLQLVPPTNNTPEYFHKYGRGYYRGEK